MKGIRLDKNGKPFKEGKAHSVTVLSDPNYKINKNYKILQVFRKAEEINDKKLKDDNVYYYTKLLAKLINKGLPEVTEVPRDTDNKDIFINAKGDMINKLWDQNNDLFVIKVPAYKNINDVFK